MQITHTPVLVEPILDLLAPASGSLLIDGTVGEGGHSERFLESFLDLRIVGLDTDKTILNRARERLSGYGGRFSVYNTWFDEFFDSYGLEERPDRVLLDLGISMYHYKDSERGFTFSSEEPLDMRLRGEGPSAADIIRDSSEAELADLIYLYGEERLSRRIARAIVGARSSIHTSGDLERVIWKAVPTSYRRGRIHPATRTFQALRIAVNHELERLSRALPRIVDVLKPGGRLGVISFHSLEDRIVKRFFRDRSSGASGNAPMDKTGGDKFSVVTKKPIVADEDEKTANPASRSAKFRVLEKVGSGDQS